jgi:chromatin remodeling complex protein RSC6
MTTPTKTSTRKTTKSQKSSSTLTESASTPVVSQVEETKPQPVVEVKVQPVVVQEQVPVVEVQPAVVEQQEVVEVNHFETLNSKLKQAQTLLRDLSTELNHLQKEVDKLKKSSKKSQSKSRKSSKTESTEGGSTTRSGINKEVNVSEQLASFLNVPADTKVSRIQVSRAVSEYITKHNLQNPTDRRNIVLDETLTKLLNPPQNVNVSYFNLQTYLKPHYRS